MNELILIPLLVGLAGAFAVMALEERVRKTHPFFRLGLGIMALLLAVGLLFSRQFLSNFNLTFSPVTIEIKANQISFFNAALISAYSIVLIIVFVTRRILGGHLDDAAESGSMMNYLIGSWKNISAPIELITLASVPLIAYKSITSSPRVIFYIAIVSNFVAYAMIRPIISETPSGIPFRTKVLIGFGYGITWMALTLIIWA